MPDEYGNLTLRENKYLSRIDVIREMIRLQQYFSGDKSMFDIWKMFFPKVCPISLVAEFPQLDHLVSLESAASQYNQLPYDGGYLDQPIFVIQAFDAVRSARSEYERDYNQRIESKRKKEEKKNRK